MGKVEITKLQFTQKNAMLDTDFNYATIPSLM